MRVRVAGMLTVCLLVPALVPAAFGQTAATISGTVQDANGGVLPGVTVTVTNRATALTR